MEMQDEVERKPRVGETDDQGEQPDVRRRHARMKEGPQRRLGKGDEAEQPGPELAHLGRMIARRHDQPRFGLTGPQ